MIDEISGAVRVSRDELDLQTRRVLHKTIDAVGREIDGLSFNTAIAKLIELTNALSKAYGDKPTPVEAARALVLMMAPLTPHIAEELWSRLRGAGLVEEGSSWSVTRQPFPTADAALLVEESVELPVQVAGKIKARITVAASADEAFVRETALADERVQAALAGKTVQKVIVVPGRMVNIVAS
jgi:leucyl-tRNA synthetase